MKISRRDFVKSAGTVTLGFIGLHEWVGSLRARQPYGSQVERYGELVPDSDGLLDLPEGFTYKVLSRTGDAMDDGLKVPGKPDGMAAFHGPEGKVIIVCNHELTPDAVEESGYGADNAGLNRVDMAKFYDKGLGERPHLGGTSTLIYSLESRMVETHFLSLAGTCRNCAGGPTPWGSWLTCEESVQVARSGNGDENTNEKDHGYIFQVPATPTPMLTQAVPLKAMGRFNHEAVAVDPKSGVVFQTEDRHDGLIYRFIPNEAGILSKGGRLQALAIRGEKGIDTRNWPETKGSNFPVGESLPVEWIDLENVASSQDDLRYRGLGAGAARFARGEGMWYGNEEIYFACTNGGASMGGQIFRYVPSPFEGTAAESKDPGRLELYTEPNDTRLLENADNLTVAPWGDVILCEDGADEKYLRGITPEGKLYTLGYNRFNQSEFAGACFAPGTSEPTLFVNIQTPGITLAITGPWA